MQNDATPLGKDKKRKDTNSTQPEFSDKQNVKQKGTQQKIVDDIVLPTQLTLMVIWIPCSMVRSKTTKLSR